MKKRTYKLIETISKSIIAAFPYLTAKEHSEVMENFIYESLKSKIKEGLSNSPLNPTYETDGIFNYPYGKKDTNVEEFIKANPATLSLAAALVAVTGWSLIKCVKFIIKKGEDAAKLLVNLGKNSDKKTLLKKAIDKYVNN